MGKEQSTRRSDLDIARTGFLKMIADHTDEGAVSLRILQTVFEPEQVVDTRFELRGDDGRIVMTGEVEEVFDFTKGADDALDFIQLDFGDLWRLVETLRGQGLRLECVRMDYSRPDSPVRALEAESAFRDLLAKFWEIGARSLTVSDCGEQTFWHVKIAFHDPAGSLIGYPIRLVRLIEAKKDSLSPSTIDFFHSCFRCHECSLEAITSSLQKRGVPISVVEPTKGKFPGVTIEAKVEMARKCLVKILERNSKITGFSFVEQWSPMPDQGYSGPRLVILKTDGYDYPMDICDLMDLFDPTAEEDSFIHDYCFGSESIDTWKKLIPRLREQGLPVNFVKDWPRLDEVQELDIAEAALKTVMAQSNASGVVFIRNTNSTYTSWAILTGRHTVASTPMVLWEPIPNLPELRDLPTNMEWPGSTKGRSSCRLIVS